MKVDPYSIVVILEIIKLTVFYYLLNLNFPYRLSAAAMSNLTELSDTSTTGLQFMVDHKQILDINVDVRSTYVIIPENGVFDG